MITQSASQASSTVENSPADNRKRKREVLSCLDCRRRKLRCDRSQPACSRCVKGGSASSCTYKNFHGSADENQDDEDASAEEDIRAPKRARAFHDGRPTNSSPTINREVVPRNYSHSSTAFSSQSNIEKSLEQRLATLENVLSLTRTAGRFQLEGSRSALAPTTRPDGRRVVEEETHLFKGKGVRTQFYGPSNPTSLLAHFPEVRVFMKDAHSNSSLKRVQNECNLVDARLKGSLNKVPLVSNPLDLVPDRSVADRLVNLYFDTFELTYRILHRPTFRRDYESFWQAPEQAPRGFVPSLLLVMATVRCMSPREPLRFNIEGSTVRSEAIQWIRACDFWLTQQSQKNRVLAMYQVMCLRFLAASANSLKVKEAYTRAEHLLTYFKAAGMHRDPYLLLDRCSPYEMEMRRRLWATVMELELQASIDRGMPSLLAGLTFDCPPPLNINDENLMEQSVKLPIARPSEEYTKTSFLDISSRSLSLRISLCSLINDPSSSMPFSDVLRYDQQINEALESIPQWKGNDTTQISTLLDLQLRQFILLIHAPFARRKDSSQSRYSRMGILASFGKMLAIAFKILEEKCMRRGEGFQYYWHVSAAFSFVQSRLGNESIEDVKFRATDRIAKFYHRVLAFQEGPEKPSTIPPPSSSSRIEGGPTGPNLWFYGANNLEFTSNESAGPPLDYSDAFDYSDWTLDNFWPLDGQHIATDLSFLR